MTITGTGFNASSGNVVTLGYRTAEVLSANATHMVVQVPKHVGGTYQLSIHVSGKGLAAVSGAQGWFRFDSGIENVSPKIGSRYGGQHITLSGFGFAPVGSGSTDEDTDYETLFSAWTNFGTATSED